jgi:hypothetical protein
MNGGWPLGPSAEPGGRGWPLGWAPGRTGGARCMYWVVAADMVLARSCGCTGAPVIVWLRELGRSAPNMLEKAASRWLLLAGLMSAG